MLSTGPAESSARPSQTVNSLSFVDQTDVVQLVLYCAKRQHLKTSRETYKDYY